MVQDFCSNMTVHPKYLGIGVHSSPNAQMDSSQRLTMHSAHMPQAMVLDGGQPPLVATGAELLLGDYEFNPSKLDSDIQVLATIPKFIPGCGIYPLKADSNPMSIVIYLNNDTREVDYFVLSKYTKGADGHGYINNLMNTNMLMKDSYIPKDMQFQTSPCHKNGMYGLGLNANVVYMSAPAVTEDAIWVSDEFARKCDSWAFRTINFKMGIDQIPLNLYSTDGEEYKIMPDIGESVRSDCILVGFRTPTAESFVSDTQFDALTRIQPRHDTLYFVQHPESIVVDIDIYVNKRQKIPKNIYYQVQKYQDQSHRFHQAIVDTYTEACNRGYKISYPFNTLVTRSMALLRAEGRTKNNFPGKANLTLIQKKDPIEFISVSVTYMYKNVYTCGYKNTGQCGDKGVASIVMPKHMMPKDKYGVVADMVIEPSSVVNRMNVGQLSVQDINRRSLFMQWRLEYMLHGGDIHQPFTRTLEDGTITPPIPPVSDEIIANTPYDLLVTYMHDINPNYAMVVHETMVTQEDKDNLVLESIKHGIYLVMPPYLNHVTPQWYLDMEKKYPAPATELIISTTRRDGRVKVDTTFDKIPIGAKYVYCLCKIPHLKASGPAYINQHKTPIHPSAHAKLQYPISRTPVRSGEDECRNKTMAAGSPATTRYIALHANNQDGLNTMMRMLLNEPNPTNIPRVPMTTRELIKGNSINRLLQHFFATFGVDITQSVGPGDPRYDAYMQHLTTEEAIGQIEVDKEEEMKKAEEDVMETPLVLED